MDRKSNGGSNEALQQKKVSIDEGLQLAIQFHQSGRFSEARAIYKSILELLPKHAEALHFLGVLSHQYNTGEDAVALIEKAVRVSPDYADAFNNLGNVHKERGNLEQAAAAYQKVIALAPGHAAAYNNLAAVLHAQGASAQALSAYQKAAELSTGDATILYNLGNINKECGHLEAARDAYRKAIEIEPDHADAHYQLGEVLKAQGAREQAIASFGRAVELRSDRADYYYSHGKSFEEKGLREEALNAYRKALALDNQFIDAYERAVSNLYLLGRIDESVDLLGQWLSIDPGNPIGEHLRAAIEGKNIPARASNSYVEQVFDDFADSFDEALERIQYSAPQLSIAALERLGVLEGADLDVLDAGCGTGLCGPLYRPYARRLVGVDLSDAMLDKARARGVYDSLEKAELTDYLRAAKTPFDVIVAADTLVYFGDLDAVLRGMKSILRAGGLLVFTMEEAAEPLPADGFMLHYHGRYSHSRAYLQQSLETAGFLLREMTSVILRYEAKQPVAGLLIAASPAK